MIIHTGHLSHLGSIVTAATVVVFMELLCTEIVFSIFHFFILFVYYCVYVFDSVAFLVSNEPILKLVWVILWDGFYFCTLLYSLSRGLDGTKIIVRFKITSSALQHFP